MSEDYYYIGEMVCIALLQNGRLPVYIPEEILQAIFVEDLELPSCVRELKVGMNTLGIPMFGRKFPMLLYLLRPSSIISLSVQHLLFLLKSEFSEECSLMKKLFIANMLNMLEMCQVAAELSPLETSLNLSLEQVKNHPLVLQRHHKFTFQ